MRAYLITYDLNRPGQNYDVLFAALKNIGTHWHFMQNAWIVQTQLSAEQVRDNLARYIDRNDKLWVSLITEAAWRGLSDDGNRWIQRAVQAA